MNHSVQIATTMNTTIFSPLMIGEIELKNRLVMGPAGRSRMGEKGVPHPLAKTYYGQRAGAGLIITEATPIAPWTSGTPASPGIYSQEQIEAWKDITGEVHRKGGKIFVQLWHAGRASLPEYYDGVTLPTAPSAIGFEERSLLLNGERVAPPIPRALGLNEIPEIIQLFVQATKNAMEAGMDGVELHGGNGYLLEQFLHLVSNTRTDEYGGSLENRARLMLEVLDAVVEVIGANRVGIRLSPNNRLFGTGDTDPLQTYEYLVKEINKRKIAYVHVLETLTHDPFLPFPSDGTKVLPMIRSNFDGVLLLNGALNKDLAEQTLNEGLADAFVFSRLFMANPDLPYRFKENLPLNDLVLQYVYEGEEMGYIDYPIVEPTTNGTLYEN
jgi:N-ethylmaleimide reductase